MSGPLIRPYIRYEALCRMAPEESPRWELFDGQAYMCPPLSVRHQELSMRLLVAFSATREPRDHVYAAPLDVVLSPGTVHQPDLVVVMEGNRHILQDVIRGTPDLVVEILSPSHAERDRVMKMETYARHGVAQYWIVDDESRRVEIYRLDRDAHEYRQAEVCAEGATARTPLLPSLNIEVRKLFE